MYNAATAITSYLIRKPRKLFLVDSAGALLTAFFLYVILRNFNEYFGMPKTTLTLLAAIAACFCFYSATCFFFLKENRTPYIRIIGVANLLYCALTLGFLIIFYNKLTILGLIYFLGEIAIVTRLAFIELNVAKAIKSSLTTHQKKMKNP